LNFYDYSNDKKKAHLIAGGIFGMLSILKVSDIFDDVRKTRKRNSQLLRRSKM